MDVNFFCFFGHNTMQSKVSKSNTCKFQCIIKYEINHDLPPFCQTTTFRKINCEELTELIKIFMRCYTFLNKQRCLQVTLLSTQLRFFLIISQKIYKICLIIVSYICIAIDITLLYTMIIKYTKEESIMGQNKKNNHNSKVFEIAEHYSKKSS